MSNSLITGGDVLLALFLLSSSSSLPELASSCSLLLISIVISISSLSLATSPLASSFSELAIVCGIFTDAPALICAYH